MAPTVEVDAIPTSSQASTATDCNSRSSSPEGWCVEVHPRRSSGDPFDLHLTIQDFDNSCETYFCSRDVTPSLRSVIPEASPAFREAMGKLKLERKRDVSYSQSNILGDSNTSSSATSSSSSSLSVSSKHKSSLSSSSSSSSSRLSPNLSENGSSKSNSKCGNSKRPASFGGADGVKLRTDRRASHCEKRVSWADERGSDHQLITVRLIRPRLAADINTATNSSPGHSILRNSGTH